MKEFLLKVKSIYESIPHWVIVGLLTGAAVFWQNLQTQPDFFSALTSWNWPTVWAGLKTSAIAVLVWEVGWIRTDPWTKADVQSGRLMRRIGGDPKDSGPPPPRVPPAVMGMFLVFASLTVSGCHSGPPSQLPNDLEQEGMCVLSQLQSGQTALSSLLDCVSGDIAILADVFDWIVSSVTTSKTLNAETVSKVAQEITFELQARGIRPESWPSLRKPLPSAQFGTPRPPHRSTVSVRLCRLVRPEAP